jgi:hypothetical protein
VVHCRVHKSFRFVPILSQMNSVHTIPSYSLRSILTLSSHLRLGLPSSLFPSGFSTRKFYAFLFPPFRAIWLVLLILIGIIILIIFGEECKLQNSSFCSVQGPLLFHSTSVQVLSSAPCPQIPSVYVSSFM